MQEMSWRITFNKFRYGVTFMDSDTNRLERQISLIGIENTQKLCQSSVAVFGIGGVGGYAVEALARCGIGKIIVIDFDTISISNINRQIIADTATVGKNKTDAVAERIKKINPDCEVIRKNIFIDKSNAGEIIGSEKVDYVIDAVDNVSAKIAIIEYCKHKNIGIVSCMGTGNKLDPTRFKITDISKTSVCPLAKVIRHELKIRGIKKVDVLFSDEEPVRTGKTVPASIAFVPSVAGMLLARHVVLKIIE